MSTLVYLQGTNGRKGHVGYQGPPGLQGYRGPQGAKGVNGSRGHNGTLGDRGPQGVKGPDVRKFADDCQCKSKVLWIYSFIIFDGDFFNIFFYIRTVL